MNKGFLAVTFAMLCVRSGAFGTNIINMPDAATRYNHAHTIFGEMLVFYNNNGSVVENHMFLRPIQVIHK
jgi:hypothetical protein